MSSLILVAIGKVLSFWASAASSVNENTHKSGDASSTNEKIGVLWRDNLGKNAANHEDGNRGETPRTLGICLHSDLMR